MLKRGDQIQVRVLGFGVLGANVEVIQPKGTKSAASGERSEEADDGGGSNVEEDLLPILGLIRQTEIALFREARQVRVCLGLLVSACLWEG